MLDKLFLTGSLLLLFTSVAVSAERPQREEAKTTPSKQINLTWAGPSKTPSEELLEFLANWETSNGEWISPQELAKMEILEISDEANHK